MDIKHYMVSSLVFLLVLIGSLPVSLYSETEGQKVIITGEIEEEEEDENGNVTKVRISYINDKYQIEGISVADQGKGKELFKGVGRSAKVVGTKTTDVTGQAIIQIASYEYLPEPEPEPEEPNLSPEDTVSSEAGSDNH